MATVNISYKNEVLTILPDPIYISLGESITWILETDPIVVTSSRGGMMMQSMVSALSLTIYFGSDFPFENQSYTAISIGGGNGHRILIETSRSIKRGEYKYGVNLKNDEKKEDIEDVDPIIIVV